MTDTLNPAALPPEPPVGTVYRFPLVGGNTGLVVRTSYGWQATGLQQLLTWADVNIFEGLELADGPGMPKLIDSDGMEWTWHRAGYLREDDGETLTAAQVKADFEAVEVPS